MLGLAIALALRTAAWAEPPPLPPSPSPSPAPAPQGAPPSPPASPAPDSELNAPLEPLDQFALDAAKLTAPVQTRGQGAGRVAYAVRIEGMPSKDLLKRFRGLSALVRGRGRAPDAEQLDARSAGDARLLASFLRSQGYFDAATHVSAAPPSGREKREVITLNAEPGARYTLDKVALTGPDTVPPGLVQAAFRIRSGQPVVAPIILAAEAQITARLPQEGYPFVKLGAHDVVLDDETHTADYLLPVDPGVRARFGTLQIVGAHVLPLWQLKVLPRFRAGDLYDSRKLDDLRRELIATGLFATAEATPQPASGPSPDGTTPVDIAVTGTPAKPHSLSGSVGYQTGLGGTAEIDWTDHDLWPPEGALTVRGLAGTQQSLAGLTFLRSDLGQRDENLQLIAQVSRETLDAYNADTAEVAATLARISTPLWQKLWTWSVGVEGLLSQETGYDPVAAATVRRTYEIAALPLQAQYDRSDDLLNPTRGFRISLQPTPEVSVGDGQVFMESLFNASAYAPVLSNLVLAGRLQLGDLFGAAVQDVAPSQRFYAGGGGSVRGYAYQGVGPKSPQGAPIGGVSSTLVSGEARWRFGDYGLVAFIDGGNVFESGAPRFTGLRFGAGLGFRYFTSFGPLRFDLATPLTRRPGDPALGVYISIGQAF